ncbi:MAG: B12-binding domain-containing radical SAM protein [Patescibacteria group bacterium]
MNAKIMKKTVTLISPNIVTQKGDFFGSGIPYMPFTAAYAAAMLQKSGYFVQVIDAFGEAPTKVTEQQGHFIQGLTPEEVVQKINSYSSHIVISAERVISHDALIAIIDAAKKKYPKIPIIILENTQAVSAYALREIYPEFFAQGASAIITGEPEERIVEYLEKEPKKIDGIIINEKNNHVHINEKTANITDPSKLPFPAWELFPLENYWKLGYAHAPLTGKKYLPLLTSRGCTFQCGFCVIPFTNQRKWRPRSAKNVVDEIEYMANKFEVMEFHLEDLNPTIDKRRIQEISTEILKRNLNITWKIGSGTKIETVDRETLTIMAKSGCTFLSFSPESGSLKVLKKMNKPFNHELALDLVRHMNALHITTQACFVLGYPGETEQDRQLTYEYCKKLAQADCDEIALFVMAPVPGAGTYREYKTKIEQSNKKVSLQEMSFSPRWREDYAVYKKFRLRTYAGFMLYKMLYHPSKILRQAWNIVTGAFQTKMEMTLYRIAKVYWFNIKRKKNMLVLVWIMLIFITYYIARIIDIMHYIKKM